MARKPIVMLVVVALPFLSLMALAALPTQAKTKGEFVRHYFESRVQAIMTDPKVDEAFNRIDFNNCTAEQAAVIVAEADYYAAYDAYQAALDDLEDCENSGACAGCE